MISLTWYVIAGLGEIAGCFAFWAWPRMHKSPWWIVPGVASLIAFALALTPIETSNAGTAYTARGGDYIIA
jgi:small multidrug resistance family-3 protein